MPDRLPSLSVLLALLLGVSQGTAAQSADVARSDANGKQRDARVPVKAMQVLPRAPLNDAELAIALRVHLGKLPCELGQTVLLTSDGAAAGHFILLHAKSTYRVSPQETTTGAVRLEDKAAGVVWLQLANKSMLMSDKLGRRLVDECKSPEQERTAQAMLTNPPASLLDVDVPIENNLAITP